MKKIKLFFTVLFCKILIFFMNLFGFSANNLPGNICLKIYPDILSDLQLPKTVIFMTGTNGKTATAIALSHFFRTQNLCVVNNNEGSNLDSGIISKLLKFTSLNGTVKADVAVLEVDEDAVAKLAKIMNPHYIILTNLYRDSITKNAHADYVLEKLLKIPENIPMIINADDMISCEFRRKSNPKIYFGVEKAPGKTDQCENIICDVRACPECGMPITYEYIQFHHIGRAHCDYCGYTMPDPDIYADQISEDYASYRVTDRIRNQSEIFCNQSKNLFEIYNMLSIIAVCLDLNYSLSTIRASLETLPDTGGRYEEASVNDTQIISMVAKAQNPISCSQSFEKARHIQGKKIIILAVNDRVYGTHGHHEDTSWFYDTDFEFIVSDDVINYIITGPRGYDVALRLYFAGADPNKMIFAPKYNTDMVKLVDYDAVKGGSILFYFTIYFREWSRKMKKELVAEGQKHENRTH